MGFAKGRVWKLDERALVDCFPSGGGTADLLEQLSLEIRVEVVERALAVDLGSSSDSFSNSLCDPGKLCHLFWASFFLSHLMRQVGLQDL